MTQPRPLPTPDYDRSRSILEYAMAQSPAVGRAAHRWNPATHRPPTSAQPGRHQLNPPTPQVFRKIATGALAIGALAATGQGVATAATGEDLVSEPENVRQLFPFPELQPVQVPAPPAPPPAPAAVPAPAPAPATPASTTTLQEGSSGVAVEELQRILNTWYPSLPALQQDGAFGPETADRVRHLQIVSGILVDGVVGPQTRGVLHMPEPGLIDQVRTPAPQPAPAQAAAPEQAPAGDVVKPTSGRFTSGFGSRWGSMHYGIDIANAIGTPIYATTDGVVISSGPASGFGLWVRVKHDDGMISVYGHINESLVDEGQRVRAGDQIATMGNRGQSTGPHLHFEIWTADGEKTNPSTWLRNHGISIGSD